MAGPRVNLCAASSFPLTTGVPKDRPVFFSDPSLNPFNP